MSFLKSHPIFSAVIFSLLALSGAEIWYLWSLRLDEAALELSMEQKIGQINLLQRQNPALTDDNVLLAQEDLKQSEAVLATMLRSLGITRQDELEYFSDEPADPIAAFFDIKGLVQQMQTEASSAGVLVNPSEQFGFATYEFDPPETEDIRYVYRQRRVLEYVLHRLINAHPQSIVTVQRERPAVPGGSDPASATASRSPRNQPTARASAPATGPTADFFVIDPQVSARTPGYVDTMAFRIVFVGQTAALRSFMNALAEPGLPLVVRSVEVQSLKAENSGAGGRSNNDSESDRTTSRPLGAANRTPPETVSANVPIVAENSAQFTVTVEMFEVKIQ